MKAKINKVSIQTTTANLWSLPVAAIVNSTDTELTLSPPLLNLAGADVQREVSLLGYCDVGSAVMTGAGNLPIQKLIHAVGPRWGEGAERGKLSSVVFECLQLAENNKLKSIAMPAISTGALGYPLENCATTMLTQIIDYTFEDLRFLRNIVIALDDTIALEIFDSEFQRQLADLKANDSGQVQV
jgi:O-acetyl-ADP-ribose deacetylase